MSLELCVLASGSSGNCSLVRAAGRCMLIDAGLGPRAADKRMVGTGVGTADIKAICLTHLDSDHFNPSWIRIILELSIKVYCPQDQVKLLRRLTRRENLLKPFQELIFTFNGQEFEPMPHVRCRTIRLAHDKQGSHGFLVLSGDFSIGYATDCGAVPVELIQAFAGVDILAIESNYDPDMQLNSARPVFLKQRVMGPAGHLSNQQAFAAVRAILDETSRKHGPGKHPHHVVLLHRSRECNCPLLLQRLFEQDSRIGPVLRLTHQNDRTQWLGPPDRCALPGEQLCMFAGV
jgi:phosphoribosyl 1,2-cyclic phosphodiesterase